MIHRTHKICSPSKIVESIKLLKQTFINNGFSKTVFEHILKKNRNYRVKLNTTSVDAEIRAYVNTEVLEQASNVITISDVEARADASNGQDDRNNDDHHYPHHNHQSPRHNHKSSHHNHQSPHDDHQSFQDDHQSSHDSHQSQSDDHQSHNTSPQSVIAQSIPPAGQPIHGSPHSTSNEGRPSTYNNQANDSDSNTHCVYYKKQCTDAYKKNRFARVQTNYKKQNNIL